MGNRSVMGLAVAMVLAMGAAGSARADVGEYLRTAAVKGGLGLAQIAYAPVDLVTTPAGFAVGMDGDGRAALGFGLGIFVGPINASLRALAGARDVLTFPFCDVDRAPSFHFDPYLTSWNPMGARPDPVVRTVLTAAPRRAPRPSGD